MIDFKGGNSLHSWYLILELCQCSLAHFVDYEQRFTLCQVKCVFKDIMDGMAYLHHNQIIHRDIKPSNDRNQSIVFDLTSVIIGLTKCTSREELSHDFLK